MSIPLGQPGRLASILFTLLVLLPVASNAAGAEARARKVQPGGPYCGLYCLHGALQAVGKGVPFESLLRPRYLSEREGSSVKELRQAATDAGAHAVALAGLSAESLLGFSTPGFGPYA